MSPRVPAKSCLWGTQGNTQAELWAPRFHQHTSVLGILIKLHSSLLYDSTMAEMGHVTLGSSSC